VDLYVEAVAFPLMIGRGRRVLTTGDMRGVSMQAVTRRVRRGVIHRPTTGAYVFGEQVPTLVEELRAALSMSPGAVAGFHTAAALHGFGLRTSPLIHPGAARPEVSAQGSPVHQTTVAFEPVEVLGLPRTPAARTAIDLVRVLPRIEALPVLDAALYAVACTPKELQAELDRLAGLCGACQARELVPLANPRSQCRQESQLRLILHDGGLTRFIPQFLVVSGAARHYLDLGDPGLRVGAEYDGSSHLDRARLRADRARHNLLEGLGWRMRYFTSHDIYHAPEAICPTIRRASAR
jgi:very-short-patch-repair endonuclease